MSNDLEKIREETRTTLRHDAYFWIVMTATVMISAASSIWISVTLTHRTEGKLCAFMASSDEAYRKNPPTSDLGRQQAANYARFRRELGCPLKGF